MVKTISETRKLDSLVLIDIAVPRDIEPGIDAIQIFLIMMLMI